MKNFHSDDLIVARTVSQGETWAAGVPVRLGSEVIVPIKAGTAGKSIPCVRRGEVMLPVADGEELTEGAYAYWDEADGALYAEAAESRFLVGTAGITSGGGCPVALLQSGPSAPPQPVTDIGPEQLAPLVLGETFSAVAYAIPAGFAGETELTAPVASVCLAVLAHVTAEAENGEIVVTAGQTTIATLPATAQGPVWSLASYEATPGTVFTVIPSTDVEGRVLLLLIPAEAGT